MSYQYQTVEVSHIYEVDSVVQRFAKEGWRLHTLAKNNHYSRGHLEKADPPFKDGYDLTFENHCSFIIIFEKKSVIEEIKDIVNGTEDSKAP